MDGAATIRALHKLNPNVQVVVSSGLHASGNPAEVTGLIVQGFLPKPYTAEKPHHAARGAAVKMNHRRSAVRASLTGAAKEGGWAGSRDPQTHPKGEERWLRGCRLLARTEDSCNVNRW